MEGGGARENYHVCGQCGKEGTNLRCKACLVVYYCDRDCQKTDWKLHKPICRLTSTIKKDDAPVKSKAKPESKAKPMAKSKAVSKSKSKSKSKSVPKATSVSTARLDDILLLRRLCIEDMLSSLFVERFLGEDDEDDDYFFDGDYDYGEDEEDDYDYDDEEDDEEEEAEEVENESPGSGVAAGGTNSNERVGLGVAQGSADTSESVAVAVAQGATNTNESLGFGVAHGATNTIVWHEGISKEEVYVRLIDSFRLRRDDEYTQCGDVCEFYGGWIPMPGFKRYMKKAKAKKVLPKWWSPEHDSKVKSTATTHDWANINYAVEEHDIVDHYTPLNKPFEILILRRLAAEIDGPISYF